MFGAHLFSSQSRLGSWPSLRNAGRVAFASAFGVILGLGLLIGGADRAQANPGIMDLREEIQCLALNIYFEARGEPDLGKVAVGHVVLNRVADKRFPTSVCDVVQQGGEKRLNRCQFSWWCDGRSDEPEESAAWKQSQMLARHVFWGFSEDPTAGALWYHASRVKPIWRKALIRGPKIGDHQFYSGEDRPRVEAALN